MLEVVLTLAIGAAIFGIAADIMMRQADTYSFVANRKKSVADVRYAIDRMAHEFRHLETTDILNISSSKIDFVDEYGQIASFELGTNGSDLAIYRGNDVLIPSVQSFLLEYQDGWGNPLAADPTQIPNVRRIKLTLTTAPYGDEGSVTLRTTVVPRSFIGYTNYQ